MIKEVIREFSGILIGSSIPDHGYYYYIIFLDSVKSGLVISELLKINGLQKESNVPYRFNKRKVVNISPDVFNNNNKFDIMSPTLNNVNNS